MAFDNRFGTIAPPIPETYYPGHWSPVRVEELTQSRANGRGLWTAVHWETLRECIRRIEGQCQRASQALHCRLLEVYGSRVKVTMIVFASRVSLMATVYLRALLNAAKSIPRVRTRTAPQHRHRHSLS